MGKAIVYCQICGQSLHENDFERGKASRIDNRPYCIKCRPPIAARPAPPTPTPTPTPTSRRTSTDRIPVSRPPSGSERPPSTTRLSKIPARRSSNVALWGSLLFITIVGAVGLTLAIAGRKPSSSPEPAPLTEPKPLPRSKPAPLGTVEPTPPTPRPKPVPDPAESARGLLALGLREGLVGHWTLDETDGTVARDSSGRGNDGRILGSPVRVQGKIGGAFQFRGNGEDGVEISAANELDIVEAKSYSIAAWFQPEKQPPGRAPDANDGSYAILVRQGMHVGLSYDRDGRAEMGHWLADRQSAFLHSSDTIAPAAWTHVVGIVDAVSGRTRIFIGGKPSGESSWPARSKTFPSSMPWRIGIALPNATIWGWSAQGVIDDVRFYSRALAADEIALLAEATPLPVGTPGGRTPSNDGLVLHLRAETGVTTEGTTVNAWADVERNIVTRSDGDERPTWKDRSSIVFDGRNDRVVLAGLAEHAFKESDSFTLWARVHLETVQMSRWQGVFARSVEKPPWYGIYLDPQGRWVFGGQGNLHGSPAKVGGSTVVAVQVGGKERRLYVNGLRVATGPPMDGSGAGDLWIGGVKGRGEYLLGAIQELRLWRRALDPAELIVK